MNDPTYDQLEEMKRWRRAAVSVVDLRAIENAVIAEQGEGQRSFEECVRNAVAIYCAHVVAEARK